MWKFEKTKEEYKAFKNELKTGSDREWYHNYVDFFVEMNRHMPYTKGHVEAFTKPGMLLLIGLLVF